MYPKKVVCKVLFAFCMLSPLAPLFAIAHGGGGGARFDGRYPEQFNNRHYVDPNYYWNGGGYGGIIDNGAVIVDPNAGSGAGMTDDSDQLYNSYLQDFGVTH